MSTGTAAYLRTLALIAVFAGILGSEILVVRAIHGPQHLLMVAFIVWIALPLLALAWANIASPSWPIVARLALYFTTFVISLGSLGIYAGLIRPPAGSPRAFVFVAGPLASWALMLIVIPIAIWTARHRPA